MPTIIEDEVLYFTGETFPAVTNVITDSVFDLPENPEDPEHEEPEAVFSIVDFSGTEIGDSVIGSRVEDSNTFSANLLLPTTRGQYRWRVTVSKDGHVYRQVEKIYVYGYA